MNQAHQRFVFGSKLKEARLDEGFSTCEALSVHLRDEWGIRLSARSLYRYERGTHSPTCEILAALIRALPTSCGTFYTESFFEQMPDAKQLVGTLNNV